MYEIYGNDFVVLEIFDFGTERYGPNYSCKTFYIYPELTFPDFPFRSGKGSEAAFN